MESYLWAIPLLPLAGAIINGTGALTGKLSRSAVHVLACLVVLLAFILSLVTFFEIQGLAAHGEHGASVPALTSTLFTWIAAGDFQIGATVMVDPLSAIMILVITGVGFLIHLYSTGYMGHEESYARYFAYLNLFTFAMLLLVMGENMLLMFVGWEGVGVCSYLLIGFWFSEGQNADAGKKAFIVNRIGDLGFILGIFLLYWTLDRASGVEATLSFPLLAEVVNGSTFTPGIATAVCLLLFVGATGKSAQIPLYVWLPDAMAGPTPVSALIHAATMVTAGVYMIVRLNFLFMLSPTAMTVVALVGALTAFFAATIGLAQNDIKKVLAYSTVSQLGYMFMAVGLGAFSAGLFHLVTHAFFKACLFLGSGSVIHAMGGEQDMRKMGGLKAHMPTTFMTFLVSTIAIAGIAPTAGFMSKDEILAKALMADPATTLVPGVLIYILGFAGALLTTFYMFRLVFMTFFGRFRGDKHTEEHLHESPFSMTLPLILLGVLALVGGAINVPAIFGGGEWLHHWLSALVHKEPHWSHLDHGLEIGLMVVLQLLVFATIALAYHIYVKRGALTEEGAALSPAHRLLLNKYYIDELYMAAVVRPLAGFSRTVLWRVVDSILIDGTVNGIAKVVALGSGALGRLQTGQLNFYAFSIVAGTLGVVAWLILV